MVSPYVPIPCQRERFGIPDEITYFNCAYLSPLMQSVREAGRAGIERKARPWEFMPEHFFNESDVLRARFAGLIGAEANEIAIIPSASYGIGIAAKNIPLGAGRRVVLLADQFPSNVYPWRAAAQENEAEIVTVPRPSDGNWTQGILEAVDERVGVVAIPNCHWTDGSLVDLVRVGRKCQASGIPLVLDITQSLGAMPFNIEAVKPAFLIAATYKWLLGPYSLAYLYVSPEYREGTPLEYNWISREDSANFARLVDYTDHIIPNAQRFDVGERSNFTLLPMALAALEQIHDWGVPRIAATLGSYNNELARRVRALGFRTIPDAYRSPHLIGLYYPGKLPPQLAGRLADEKVYVSIRGDAIRVAPHLYNNQADLDRFIHVLERAL